MRRPSSATVPTSNKFEINTKYYWKFLKFAPSVDRDQMFDWNEFQSAGWKSQPVDGVESAGASATRPSGDGSDPAGENETVNAVATLPKLAVNDRANGSIRRHLRVSETQSSQARFRMNFRMASPTLFLLLLLPPPSISASRRFLRLRINTNDIEIVKNWQQARRTDGW